MKSIFGYAPEPRKRVRRPKEPPYAPEPYSQGPYAHAVHDGGGKLIDVPFPSRAKWNAQLAAYAPGCGSPMYPYGKEAGEVRCGANVKGLDGQTKKTFCDYCKPEAVAEELVEFMLNGESPDPHAKKSFGLEYRPFQRDGEWVWYWVLHPEDRQRAVAHGQATSRAAASIEARKEARKLRGAITQTRVAPLQQHTAPAPGF